MKRKCRTATGPPAFASAASAAEMPSAIATGGGRGVSLTTPAWMTTTGDMAVSGPAAAVKADKPLQQQPPQRQHQQQLNAGSQPDAAPPAPPPRPLPPPPPQSRTLHLQITVRHAKTQYEPKHLSEMKHALAHVLELDVGDEGGVSARARAGGDGGGADSTIASAGPLSTLPLEERIVVQASMTD